MIDTRSPKRNPKIWKQLGRGIRLQNLEFWLPDVIDSAKIRGD